MAFPQFMAFHHEVTEEHGQAIEAVNAAGISIFQILKWIAQYGPVFFQILSIIIPFLKSGKLPSMPVLLKWFEDALAALAAGKDIPPFPQGEPATA